ncbi:hypothetical protein HN51_032981 [Arachis hypogaea]|uniref:Late embryogenesis abundant protein LEA-2 subgroup domain-containing protein n=1 Tax=Arachis hypogaea TaxID=3818 RepID=A0A445B2K3_ARAHY|nr:uncharacterized protein DS421_10g311740 [Arachis hypogaea]RYR32889.1 hypothetical protein Ahy_A10g047418 [Arachis hypogaea]
MKEPISMASGEPQNERDHAYRFSPLPQSETQHDDEDEEDEGLSIAVEPKAPVLPKYYCLEDETLYERTCETIQDIFGITVFIVLIFLPIYRSLGTPTQDPVPPVFTINSMYLSNGATWHAKFTIINTNVSSIYFRTIDFTLFYKTNPEDVLSSASSYPFYLDKGEYVKLRLNFERTTTDSLVEEIEKDRVKDGSLNFGMQIKVEAIYYGEIWVSDVEMSPRCEDLKIQFRNEKDYSGRLANPNRNCTVPMQWKQMSFF